MSEKENQTVQDLHSMRRMIRWGGLIILLLLTVLSFVVIVDRNNESSRRQRETDGKIEARIEACHLYNTDQTTRREFQKQNILTLVELGGKRDVESVKISPEFEQYSTFVDESYPYRQCSKECVDALYSASVPDCAPARNEEGEP